MFQNLPGFNDPTLASQKKSIITWYTNLWLNTDSSFHRSIPKTHCHLLQDRSNTTIGNGTRNFLSFEPAINQNTKLNGNIPGLQKITNLETAVNWQHESLLKAFKHQLWSTWTWPQHNYLYLSPVLLLEGHKSHSSAKRRWRPKTNPAPPTSEVSLALLIGCWD